MRTIVLSVGVLVATFIGATDAVTPTRPTSSAVGSTLVAAPSGTPPELTDVPARVLIDERPPSTVIMKGEGFEPGLSLTLVSDSFGFTYGPRVLTPTSFDVDLSAMNDGTYHVYVTDVSGRRSNQMTMVVGHGANRDVVGKGRGSAANAPKPSPSRDSRLP